MLTASFNFKHTNPFILKIQKKTYFDDSKALVPKKT